MKFDALRAARPTRCRRPIVLLVAAAIVLMSSAPRLGAAAAEPGASALLTAPGPAASVESIRRIVASASAAGFSAVVVPASLFDSPAPGRFDTLAEFIRQAHAHGVRVHAVLDVKAAAAADELPIARTHVVYQHPEWLMVPRDIATALLPIDPHAPNYFGQISRWTRANTPRIAAVSLSPLSPEATAFIGDAVRTFVSRYELDGIALDGLNYPGDDFDYSRNAVDHFRTAMRASLSDGERARMDGIEVIDPFAYTNEFPSEWRRFRMSRLTDLVARIRTAVEAARPGTAISAAVGESADVTLDEYVQEWMDNRLVDTVTHKIGAAGTIVFAPSVKLTAASIPAPAAATAGAR